MRASQSLPLGIDMTHAWRDFIVREMTQRTWQQKDLVRESKLSRSHVSKLVNDQRDRLPQPPDEATVTAIAGAFRTPVPVAWRIVGRAMGLPDQALPEVVHEVRAASDEELLAELKRRADLRKRLEAHREKMKREWDEAISNRDSPPKDFRESLMLTVWDRETKKLYTTAEALELGLITEEEMFNEATPEKEKTLEGPSPRTDLPIPEVDVTPLLQERAGQPPRRKPPRGPRNSDHD